MNESDADTDTVIHIFLKMGNEVEGKKIWGEVICFSALCLTNKETM